MLLQGARACQTALRASRREDQRWVEYRTEQIGGGKKQGFQWEPAPGTAHRGDAGFCFAAVWFFFFLGGCFSNRAAIVQRGINPGKLCCAVGQYSWSWQTLWEKRLCFHKSRLWFCPTGLEAGSCLLICKVFKQKFKFSFWKLFKIDSHSKPSFRKSRTMPVN